MAKFDFCLQCDFSETPCPFFFHRIMTVCSGNAHSMAKPDISLLSPLPPPIKTNEFATVISDLAIKVRLGISGEILRTLSHNFCSLTDDCER